MDVVVGNLQPEDAQQEARLRAQAFEPNLGPYYDPNRPSASGDRVHVAKAGTKIVATVTVLPLGQWFGGVALPMGGVAGVAVAPEARGHGLARRLLSDALAAMRDRGEVVSALYPTTSALYRSMGYEYGGRWERLAIDVRDLALRTSAQSGPRSGLSVEELGPGELSRIRPLYDRLAARTNGWVARSDLAWERLDYFLNPTTSNSFGYVITEGANVVAGLTISNRQSDNRHMFDVDIGGPFAMDNASFDAALALVGGLSTTAERAILNLPVETAAIHLPHGILSHAESWQWMFRLVDVGEALRRRGYNPNVTTRFSFDLVDETAPWNTGAWNVDIGGGTANVDRGTTSGPARVSLDVQTLSCLFTGYVSPWDLATAGRLPGADSAMLDALTAAFFGLPPRMVDYF